MERAEDLIREIETDEKSVSTKLRSLRVQAGMKCGDFAETLGISVRELESYEDGSEEVPASIVALVSALSGVSLEYFFSDEPADDDCDEEAIIPHAMEEHMEEVG